MVSDGAVAASPTPAEKQPIKWGTIFWVSAIHAGALFAPFTFSWSGLAAFLALYILTGLGITLGYHRLLTHRSYSTWKPIEYFLTLCGIWANEGGPLRWVCTHRLHHTHSDEEEDPHSPKQKGFWWAHAAWWMRDDPKTDGPIETLFNVKDLARDPVHRFFQRTHAFYLPLLAVLVFGAGYLYNEAFFGDTESLAIATSWLIWGMFVRTVWVLHTTWFVNSASHIWGYRNFETTDDSKNNWWVAALTFGEGWHNNHHAYQRSARHGLRWWEIDITYACIQVMAVLGLARNIHIAPKPHAKPGTRKAAWRILFPLKKQAARKGVISGR